jgi:hypothetical protein
MSNSRTLDLIEELRSLPAEISWVEFKENQADPVKIGKLISALSNAARLADQHFAYLIWQGGAFKVTLYAPRKFAQMTREERIRACYQHAVLKYVSGEKMQNSSLRKRLGIEEGNASQVSQVINQALQQKLIRPADPERPRSAYIPFWA